MSNFIIIGGKDIPTPFECLNWKNAPTQVKRHTKVYKRIKPCRMIVIHTVHGRTCRTVVPGAKASTRDLMWARSHWNSSRGASTDGYIDTDGSVAWANDPAENATWGAGQVNAYAMHFEIVTDEDGQMYQASLDSLGHLVVLCCEALGIQMQTPWDHVANEPYAGRIHLVDPAAAGVRCVGVIGHRNIWMYQKTNGKADPSKPLTSQRGFGDPNSWPFLHLVQKHGFEKLAFHSADSQTEPEVISIWKQRQRGVLQMESRFGAAAIDGVPLAQTVNVLKERGYAHGLWARGT